MSYLSKVFVLLGLRVYLCYHYFLVFMGFSDSALTSYLDICDF